MQNLIQIDIFDSKVKAVIKSNDTSNKRIAFLETLKKWMEEISTKNLIKIFFTYDDQGNLFFDGNQIMVQKIDYIHGIEKNAIVFSEEELKEIIFQNSETDISNGIINISEYDTIMFEKSVFMNIIMLTQQYLNVNKIEIDSSINLEVLTPTGNISLFENGISNNVGAPIIGIVNQSNINEHEFNNKTLVSFKMNNCITALNLETGTYYLSIDVKDIDNNVATIYVKRNIKEFWSNLCIMRENADIYFGLNKGTNNL